MAKCFLMTGPSGAGKTELSKTIVSERNLRYLSIENFYSAFFGSELIHEHEEEVWEAFYIAIQVALDDNVDILIDTNSPSRADREWFIERFPKFEFHLIVVEASKEICFLNNHNRERTIPEDEMERIYNSLEPVNDDEIKKYAGVELYRNTDNTGVKFVKRLK